MNEVSDKHTNGKTFPSVVILEGIVLLINLVNKLSTDISNLTELEKQMSQDVTDFVANVEAKFTAIGAAVDTLTANFANISADEAAQAKQIADLQAQILAGPSTLSAADQAALAAVVADAQTQADKVKAAADASQAVADSIPDTVTPPPAPTPAP